MDENLSYFTLISQILKWSQYFLSEVGREDSAVKLIGIKGSSFCCNLKKFRLARELHFLMSLGMLQIICFGNN